MILPSEIRFVDENTKKAFYHLKEGDNSEKELFKFINQAIDNIEKNAFCGIQIPKKQIPREYIKKYEIANLWKYDLPNAWRLIYSIRGGKAFVVSIILEWLSHKEYNKRFNY
jgi:Txe/YoeB family toxin of Txe-Axe toxin-antitoxin module